MSTPQHSPSNPGRLPARLSSWARRPDVARMLASTLGLAAALTAVVVNAQLPHRDTAVEVAAEASRIEAALNASFVEPIRYEHPLGIGDASRSDSLGYLVVDGIIYDCSAQLLDPEQDTEQSAGLDAPFIACEGPVPQLTPEPRS